MLNQAGIEALYSATYIENYMDYVENLPNELQRHVSRVRELDLTFHGFLKEVEQQRDASLVEAESIAKKKLFLSRVQQALICAQELGDEKLQILQQVQDIIDNKTRQLDGDYRKLADIGKDEGVPEQTKEPAVREGICLPISTLNNGGSAGERQSKRVRRTRTDVGTPSDIPAGPETIVTPDPIRQVQLTPQQTPPVPTVTSNNQKKTSGTSAIGKKKKRKSRQGSQTQQAAQLATRDDSPPRDEEMAIDPDEPTYCLCDQISYGEMIMCDNDLCPYEWFHFSCVSLGVKPKGKWFCPKCRGDRSSIMKPKAQFMKELERLKQEKELKEEKGS